VYVSLRARLFEEYEFLLKELSFTERRTKSLLRSRRILHKVFSLSLLCTRSFNFMSLHKTATEKLVVTLRRGLAGKRDTIKLTCKALGLRKPRASRVVPNTSTSRGQIEKIKHLVKVETETAFLKRLERKEKKFSLRPEIVVEH